MSDYVDKYGDQISLFASWTPHGLYVIMVHAAAKRHGE